MNTRKGQRGFSLIELMIGLVIGLIVMSGAIYVFLSNAETNIYQMRSTRFVQQMRDVMDRMVSDIRRAGYMGYQHYVNTGTLAVDNPFASDSLGTPGLVTNISRGAFTGEAANSCITYAYNRDDDFPALVGGSTSLDPTVFDSNNTEMYGFRLRAGAVEMRTGMGGASTFDCNSGAWQDLTDADIVTINSLTFSLASTGCSNVTDASRSDCYSSVTPSTLSDDPASGDLVIEVREVQISMTGASANDANLTFTLNQVVDLPNDRAYIEP